MADEDIEGIAPTRMEYLKLKDKLLRATKGHRLLKEKRDSLVMEFMDVARQSYDIASLASDQIAKAHKKMALAQAMAGQQQISNASMAQAQDLNPEISYRNIMGIRLASITAKSAKRKSDERGYSLLMTHPSIDSAAKEYEKSIDRLIELASTVKNLQALSEETKKTKRRVNAIEYKVIPSIKTMQKKIRMRLDELEREGFYSRKMIKMKAKGAV